MSSASDRQAFEDAFIRHGPALLSFAVRRLDGVAAAEDAVSEAFLAAWRNWGKRPAVAGETLPWLYQFAGNAVRDQRRSSQRGLRLSARASMYVFDEVRSEHAAECADLQHVAEALADLSPADQEILRLTAWEEVCTSRDLALALGIAPTAARVRLHRARRRLHERLKASGPSSETTEQSAAPAVQPRAPLSAGA